MSIAETIKNKIVENAVQAVVTIGGISLVWAASQFAPLILPFINETLTKQMLVAFLIVSVVLNLFLALVVMIITKASKNEFRLKYGIYWDKDKNPHCPACKVPIGAYSKYQVGWGYYCKPCKKIFSLTDVSGNNIKPEQAVNEL